MPKETLWGTIQEGPYRPLSAWRQRGRHRTYRVRRQGATEISTPKMASFNKLWTSFQLLTTSSWDPRWLSSASVKSASQKRYRHLRPCSHSIPRKAGNGGHGGNEDAWATWDRALTKQPVAWASQTWEGHKTHNLSRSEPLQSIWELKWLRFGKSIGSWEQSGANVGQQYKHWNWRKTEKRPYPQNALTQYGDPWCAHRKKRALRNIGLW